jgi:hypothetical protein
MNPWVLYFLTANLFLATTYNQQDPPGIKEESISSELKADPKVSSILRNIKAIQRRLDGMGAKHPSRKLFEESLSKEESLLRQRLSELRADNEPEPNERVPTPKLDSDDSMPREETPGMTTPSALESTSATQPGMKLDSRRDAVSESVEIGVRDALFVENSYPWIINQSFTGIGCFSRTGKMWGIEAHYDPSGIVNSGTIWQWGDRWREKSSEVFWTCGCEILAFHPSTAIVEDGLWFVVLRNRQSDSDEIIEIWAYQGWPNQGVPTKQQMLCRGQLGSPTDILSLHYESLEKKLYVGVMGEFKVTNRLDSLVFSKDPSRGLSILISPFLEGIQGQLVDQLATPFVVRNQVVISSVFDYGSKNSEQELRPFWRKRGAMPSVSPKWWSNRNHKILRHAYQEAESPTRNGDQLWGAIAGLKPGDTLIIQPGIYESVDRLDIAIKGSADAPIVIQGDGPGVVITRSDSTQNVINITNACYAAIGGIEVTGGGTGIRIQSADQLMIYNSTIHDVGNVGVSLNFRTTSGVYIIDNEIHTTAGNGEGIYAGSHDGTKITHDSYFVGNYIHDLAAGPKNQGDGIELKNRSYGNVVKWNYIVGTQYPGITVYTAGDDANPANVIEQNIILNSNDCGIQATADALIQTNWLSGNKVGIASRPFGRLMPKNIKALGNTVIGDMFALKASEWNRSDNVLANNLLASSTRNYFHSGFGRAIYISNQLVCDLKDDTDLRRICKRTTNRLITETDIFGNVRKTVDSSIGAIEFPDFDLTSTNRIISEVGQPHVAFNHHDAVLVGDSGSGSDGSFRVKCVDQNHLPLRIEKPLLQVIRLADGVPDGVKGDYLVTLLDRDSRWMYQGVLKPKASGDRLTLVPRLLAPEGVRGLGASSFGDLLTVGPGFTKSIITPELHVNE